MQEVCEPPKRGTTSHSPKIGLHQSQTDIVRPQRSITISKPTNSVKYPNAPPPKMNPDLLSEIRKQPRKKQVVPSLFSAKLGGLAIDDHSGRETMLTKISPRDSTKSTNEIQQYRSKALGTEKIISPKAQNNTKTSPSLKRSDTEIKRKHSSEDANPKKKEKEY